MPILVQLIIYTGILVPSISVMVLLKKQQNDISIYLMLADIGCMLVNVCNLLMIQTHTTPERYLVLKVLYISQSMMYIFFILFIFKFLKIKYPVILPILWFIYEFAVMTIIWQFPDSQLVYKAYNTVIEHKRDGYIHVVIETGILHYIRSTVIVALQVLCIILTTRQYVLTKNRLDKRNLAKILLAECIFFIVPCIHVLLNLDFDMVPEMSALSMAIVVACVASGTLYSASDMTMEKFAEYMNDPVVVLNSNKEFIFANSKAVDVFPELYRKRKNASVPTDIIDMLMQKGGEFERNNKNYRIKVTDIYDESTFIGYCYILLDVTERQKLMEDLIDAKEKAEIASKAKTDFLSNMSHEIRTPMNAVVGMTDILLRKEHDDIETEYLNNIKTSGVALISIINDILDYSKIESGKLELVEEEYSTTSILNDMSMIFLNRIGEKNIELLYDIDKDFPTTLYGDALRIRQIIINIMNNAVKFTEEGYVKLTIQVTERTEDKVKIHTSIRDTGQGIKREDMEKIFDSFKQLDSKRNRKKEGSGLGLAISKQLIELMGGNIGIDSEYGKGSEFYFDIEQKLVGEDILPDIKNKEDIIVAGCFDNIYMQREFTKLVDEYNIQNKNIKDIIDDKDNHKISHIFMDCRAYKENRDMIDELTRRGIKAEIIINPMQDSIEDKKITLINKPLYSVNFVKVLNNELRENRSVAENYFTFIAPEAKVLIVDDMEMNLKVACGLLAPLKMKITTAQSGKEAIEMLKKDKGYNIVFMDHMMPVMDGIETTSIIRDMGKEDDYYNELPIIALTANAMAGAKEMFQKAGMNDFVAKPIDIKEICNKIKVWLPQKLIIREETEKTTLEEDISDIDIYGIDATEGIKNCGSRQLFESLLTDFYKIIDIKAKKIRECVENDLIRDFTIEVHGLKNTARMIGATRLSEEFYRMERCGNNNDVATIKRDIELILGFFESYKISLKDYGNADDENKKMAEKYVLEDLLKGMRIAMDTFDLDRADEIMREIEEYRYADEIRELINELSAYVADVNMEAVEQTIDKLIKKCEVNNI